MLIPPILYRAALAASALVVLVLPSTAQSHMTYYWDHAPGTTSWTQPPRRPQVTVFLAQENARKTLETGVTTVRDLGSSDYNDLAMRDLINRGAMVGPRMFASGFGISRARGTP